MTDQPRLIERAFPLKQTSLDSVHEKNVRHGHISTLHIWPARRPLAACRAALIATLLPDPGTPEERRKLCEKIGGIVVQKTERKKMPNGRVVERIKEETDGGILHWKREIENAEDLEWFRQKIREAYGGRAPRVLDPFAGGGAIPLEAMRLGCETTALDINPVAWFILKCTLEYPQKLAGKTHPLPDFILDDEDFMEAFYKAHPHLVGRTKQTKRQKEAVQPTLFDKPDSGRVPKADLAWHVRAWGKWVLNQARKELAEYYPTYADFETVGQASRLPLPKKETVSPAETLAPLYLNPQAPIDIKQRHLPHWTQEGALYFVTFRLADSIPQHRVHQLQTEREAWLKNHKVGQASRLSEEELKEYYRLFSDRVENWLDAGEGSCLLRDPAVRSIVSKALKHFDSLRYNLGAWCVMPNHVHVLVQPRPGFSLSSILHSWKSYTAHEINKKLNRTGEVWQHESYDHIVRNPQSLWRIEAYILNNPTRAGLGENEASVALLSEISVGSFTLSGDRFATETVALPLRRLAPLKEDGTPDIDALNAEFSKKYLTDKHNPRWVAKPTVAYLWARTVTCKNCRATVPLLKTRWLCKKANKRVLLGIATEGTENTDKGVKSAGAVPFVRFHIENDVPVKGGNAAQRREHDKRIGEGTMSRAGAKCPCCGTIMTMEDIRFEGKSGRLGVIATAVVTEGQNGKVYRLPTQHEIVCAKDAEAHLDHVYNEIPFGLPVEPTPKGGGRGAARAFSIQNYGMMQWRDLFSSRQLLGLGVLVKQIRCLATLEKSGIPPDLREAVAAFLVILFDKTADYNSTICTWHNGRELIGHTFARYALPITWDVAELAIINEVGGSFAAQLDWVARYIETALEAMKVSPEPTITQRSATQSQEGAFDAIVTDPPYYDAIPYSDCMDFFYIWIRRLVHNTCLEKEPVFAALTSPKWDHDKNDGELIDDDSRHSGNVALSKKTYEDGMARAFMACARSLHETGRLVIVFAHKHPDAWETLVSAIIRAGFIVDGSWPIQTEMGTRMRAMSSAALSSSVWLVCKKRPATARPGWDNRVMEEMRGNISDRLRDFWDAGIRGPDFVWAATGPALEAYSKYPIVKKANAPGQVMAVGEFLSHVRRMVVDFVVGQVLTGEDEEADLAAADRMDAPTAYYLLHRHDFGLDEAPSGACILYATACGLSDHDLETTWDLLARTGGSSKEQSEEDEPEESDPDAETDTASDSGSKVKLKTWAQRKHRSMGFEAPGGQHVPLIDRLHRLMHLWKAGDVLKVDEYLDDNGLRRQELFKRLVQSLIELSPAGSDERTLLESLSNHVQAKGATLEDRQEKLFAIEITAGTEQGDGVP